VLGTGDESDADVGGVLSEPLRENRSAADLEGKLVKATPTPSVLYSKVTHLGPSALYYGGGSGVLAQTQGLNPSPNPAS
jgi:hypothetical protein